MFKKYNEKDKLTLREQKDLNTIATNFLIWTTVYWFGVILRLIIFWKGGV